MSRQRFGRFEPERVFERVEHAFDRLAPRWRNRA
jgi:hypothetical protein